MRSTSHRRFGVVGSTAVLAVVAAAVFMTRPAQAQLAAENPTGIVQGVYYRY